MNFAQSFIEAIESLTANKMRSGLTMLGIIIGVAAVIAMLALGSGAQDSIIGEIEGIGTNLLFISTDNENVINPKPLTLADAEALDDPLQAPAVNAVAAAVQGAAEVSYSGESSVVTVIGVTPDYTQVQNMTVAEGEYLNDTHLTGQASVAILGANVAEELFGRANGIIGESVRISGQPFRVIGVLTAEGGSDFGSADDQVLVPLTTAQVRVHPQDTRGEVDTIYVSAISSEAVQDAITQVSNIMRERHHTEIGAEDFSIMSQQSMVDMMSTITGILTIFLGGVAGISLLVGGIGIMNIMLVSVVERTREIGLRKAMGAQRADILSQFLVESSLLSVIGGGIGILLGWAISALVGLIATASDFALNPVIGLDAVLMATLFSGAVGIFFGLYPANRAASLEPVEALRTD
ncbi:MAG: ABC transporter permease [Anaerolineales bacterium]|nr:ABC transporter permease [Anaerolineales bacterium]